MVAKSVSYLVRFSDWQPRLNEALHAGADVVRQ